MARTALITGASSGLGAEYARQLAIRGFDLVLVARDREALEATASQLRGRFGREVEVLPADLLKPRKREKVERRLADRERPVDVLINSAGFGLPLDFVRNDVEAEVRHLEVHVEVPMRLTHAALGAMLARRRGRIINVASVSAYMPRSTYGACKRWIVEFSRWANSEYGPRGVTTTAVCPGFTHTNFHERMGLPPGDEGISDFLWLEASDVVAESLRDAARGKAVSIPSLKYKILTQLVRVMPPGVASGMGRRGR